MIQFKTISQRFIFFSVVSVTISVLVTGLTSYFLTKTSILYKLKSQDLITLATNKADKVNSKISRAIDISTTLATDPVIIEFFLSNDSNLLLKNLVLKKLKSISDSSLEFTNSFAASNITKKYYRGNTEEILDLTDKENNSWFYDAISKKIKNQININTDSKNDTYVFINIIIGDLDKPVGIAGVSLKFNDVAKEFSESDKNLNSKIWLIDQNQKIKISSNQNDLNKEISSITNEEIEKEILQNKKNTQSFEFESKEGLVDLIYLPISLENYSVLFEIPRKSTTSILKPIAYGTIIICGISIIAIFFTFLYGTKTLTRPIRRMITGLNSVSKGNLKQKIEILSNDEIGDLGNKFNEFTDRISNAIITVKANSELILESSENLKIETNDFFVNTQSQAAALEEISSTVSYLAENSETVKISTSKQNKNLSSLSSKLQDLSVEIESMNQVIISSLKNIKKVSSDMLTETQSLSLVSSSMKEIHSSSKDLFLTIEVIHDISEKVNLLALNASIEAARAGSFGKGFAVVATEISKLADKTAESVKSIDLIIRKNNKEINSGISNLESVNSKTIEINLEIEKTVFKMNQLFEIMQKQISIKFQTERESEIVKKESEEIAKITEELNLSFSEIGRAIEDINKSSISNMNGSGKIAESSVNLNRIAKDLKEEIKFFKT